MPVLVRRIGNAGPYFLLLKAWDASAQLADGAVLKLGLSSRRSRRLDAAPLTRAFLSACARSERRGERRERVSDREERGSLSRLRCARQHRFRYSTSIKSEVANGVGRCSAGRRFL